MYNHVPITCDHVFDDKFN